MFLPLIKSQFSLILNLTIQKQFILKANILRLLNGDMDNT